MTAEFCPDCGRSKSRPFSSVNPGECAVGVAQPMHGCDMTRALSACRMITIARLRSELEANGPRFAFLNKTLGLAAEVATGLRAELDIARSELEAANKRIADLDERLSIADNDLEQYR